MVDVDTHAWVDFRDLLPASGNSEAIDVNDAGQVVGFGPFGSGIGQAGGFVWDAVNGLTFLPELKGGGTAYVQPRAIDNAGRVVGIARTGAGENRAFLWDPLLGMVDLNDLVAGGGDFRMLEAKDLSETGVIIGRGFRGGAWGERGFILAPHVPAGGPLRAR